MQRDSIFCASQFGERPPGADAETTPLQHPEHYQYDFNLPDIAELWRRGSVIGSWLLDLTAIALADNPTLSNYSGFVQDSGEGRWTVMAAVEQAVPAAVLTAALTHASARARNTRLPTRSYRPCAISLAGMWKNRRRNLEAPVFAPGEQFSPGCDWIEAHCR